MRNVLIGGAWPYANGSLHIGHIAGLLPGDVLARYHRAIGDRVCFVSGSDCHGTPVAIRAKQEGKTPREISDFYHDEFKECFKKLSFSYDVCTKTSSTEHKEFVKDFHRKLYESPYVYEKETPQAYCECCDTFLADRFVLGKCSKCGEDAKHYYVHGKDNIPFHSIILPALLLGNGEKWHLPNQIVSSIAYNK